MGNSTLLTLITFLPALGAVALMLFFHKERTGAIKGFATGVAVVDFLLSIPLWTHFDTAQAGFQFVQRADWIPSIGVSYFVGVDGISVLLVLLTTVTMVVSILCSFSAIHEREKEYYVCLLLLATGMLGTFAALDIFLFYVFFEITLVPMYFLIGIWGGPRKLYAAIKFFLYTLFGSVLMLLGILALYFVNLKLGTGKLTFDLTQLYAVGPKIPMTLQVWIFLGFFIGFAIKVPMFPFHTWLPDAHVEAPTAGSVILAGILLKMGTYGFVRFVLPLVPQASQAFVPFMVLLSVIGIIYGALVSMAQTDVKKLVAYSSVSHLGFVMLGVFALNEQGVLGAQLQMINHGISTGALFLLVGIVYERRHTRMISDFGGLSKVVPVYSTFFAITMLSSMGLPGLNGFVGEFLILLGAFEKSYLYAAFAVIGIILGAAYMLWLFQRMFFGAVDNPANQKLTDCNAREVIYMLPMLALMFWIGLYPRPFLARMEASVSQVVKMATVAQAPAAQGVAGLGPAPVPGAAEAPRR
ncbi:MAG: NADH-quinone oxidoreductase subunit M [Nitrospinota bacterium]